MSLGPEQPRRPKPKPASSRPKFPDPNSDETTTFRYNPKESSRARSTSSLKQEFGSGESPGWWERIFFGKVSAGQLAAFTRQFAAYLDAGVDMGKALAGLQTQFARTALGPVTGRLLACVKRGEPLADATAREPQSFDPLFQSMIKVAEARGGVPETLKHLSRHYEARQSLIRQARSALIYPICVLFVAACVVALLTIWLLPKLAEFLKDFATQGAALPLPSRVLMALSDFIRSAGWLLIPVLLIGTPILLFQLYKTAAGKRMMDAIALRVPVFGGLLRKIDTSRFARTLASLLEAGVDVGSSLELTSDVLRLDPFRRAVRDARSQVLNGQELSIALGTSRRFAPDVIAIVNSGEETGRLPESLDKLADNYEEQVNYTVKNLGQLVQPLLLILLGGLVLFIILALFLPYISLITNLAGGR
jgi:type II secretory pathway component PulF